MQHRRFEARLLRRPAVRRSAPRTTSPRQSCLPVLGSHRRRAAAPVAPLASSEAASHLQGGSTDSQGTGYNHSGVFLRPGTDPRTNSGSSIIQRSAAPRTQTELARCAFSVAAPSIWNSLPVDIRLCESVSTFKRHLCCKRLCIFGPQGAIQNVLLLFLLLLEGSR